MPFADDDGTNEEEDPFSGLDGLPSTICFFFVYGDMSEIYDRSRIFTFDFGYIGYHTRVGKEIYFLKQL